jgi:hypothetical protein
MEDRKLKEYLIHKQIKLIEIKQALKTGVVLGVLSGLLHALYVYMTTQG